MHSIPLVAVDAAALAQFCADAKASEASAPLFAAWVVHTQFKAAPQTFCLLPSHDAQHPIAAVLVGVGVNKQGLVDDVYCLSHLPFGLPEGHYHLAKKDEKGVAGLPATGLEISTALATLSVGLGSYKFSRYKKLSRAPAIIELAITPESVQAQRLVDAATLTRDLINTPTEDMGPAHLAEAAQSIAKAGGGEYREWVGDDLLSANFPAVHAVGRASHRPPRVFEITWGNPAHPKIAIVGKGVCFDTGGLNMKGADGMRHMKKDMGGSAHALALAQLIMQAKLPVRLQMLVAAVENAVSGNAYRPGEIVSSRKGLKIEIGNTDAEGRVILADVLAYAAESEPALILDFATLTGAARVALGPELPAVFSNDEVWAARFEAAAKSQRDPIWRMPLWQPYQAMIDSSIGDVVNTGGAHAGAITAALFLQRFVPENQAWIHVDVFSWNMKNRAGRPEGGEAQSLRAAFQMIATQYPAE
jgi:leucyl aminopeptidase